MSCRPPSSPGSRNGTRVIDAYDADPARTNQKEFDQYLQLRELEQRISADIEAWKREAHGVG